MQQSEKCLVLCECFLQNRLFTVRLDSVRMVFLGMMQKYPAYTTRSPELLLLLCSVSLFSKLLECCFLLIAPKKFKKHVLFSF